LSEMIGASEWEEGNFSYSANVGCVQHTPKASGTGKRNIRKILFNIKLYSFTSVDNSCFFISWPDIFLSLRNYFHLLIVPCHSIVCASRTRLEMKTWVEYWMPKIYLVARGGKLSI
jgi:hypothetical protein